MNVRLVTPGRNPSVNALGPMIWLDYLHQVHGLERFWGSGTPDYMVNVRGALTRIFGLHRLWIRQGERRHDDDLELQTGPYM